VASKNSSAPGMEADNLVVDSKLARSCSSEAGNKLAHKLEESTSTKVVNMNMMAPGTVAGS
jgi:hypothetical protein